MFTSTPPEVLIFDAYGTLFNVSGIRQRLETHFGAHAPALDQVWRQKQLEYTWLRGMMGTYLPFSRVSRDALAFACQQAGLPLTSTMTDDLMEHYNYLPVFPEIPAALAKLSRSCRLAILSNADPAMLDAAVDHSNLRQFFDRVLSVDAIRRFKPHRSVYEMPARELEVTQQQMAFVSANTWDVAGAKSAGLRAIWVQREDKPMDKLGQLPDHRIGGLDELGLAIRLPAPS